MAMLRICGIRFGSWVVLNRRWCRQLFLKLQRDFEILYCSAADLIVPKRYGINCTFILALKPVNGCARQPTILPPNDLKGKISLSFIVEKVTEFV